MGYFYNSTLSVLILVFTIASENFSCISRGINIIKNTTFHAHLSLKQILSYNVPPPTTSWLDIAKHEKMIKEGKNQCMRLGGADRRHLSMFSARLQLPDLATKDRANFDLIRVPTSKYRKHLRWRQGQSHDGLLLRKDATPEWCSLQDLGEDKWDKHCPDAFRKRVVEEEKKCVGLRRFRL